MPYITRQKFNLSELTDKTSPVRHILLLEPEEYRLGIYIQELLKQNFMPIGVRTVDALHKNISNSSPHLLVVSSEIYPHIRQSMELVKSLKNSFPLLPMVTIGYNLSPDDLRSLLSAGVEGHIDRRFSRPADLAQVVSAVLQN